MIYNNFQMTKGRDYAAADVLKQLSVAVDAL